MDGIIEFGCVCSRSQVNNKVCFERFMIDPFNEPVPFNKVYYSFILVIQFFLRAGKIIYDYDIVITVAIEIAYHIAANESCSSCNNDLCILIHEGMN